MEILMLFDLFIFTFIYKSLFSFLSYVYNVIKMKIIIKKLK